MTEWYRCPICGQDGYASVWGDGCTACSNKRLFNSDGSHKVPHPSWDEAQRAHFAKRHQGWLKRLYVRIQTFLWD